MAMAAELTARAMGMISCLLLIAVAARAAGIIPVAPFINEQVDSVFQGGGLCQALGCNSRIEKLRHFYMWNGTWWFWPEFYGGRISGLRYGFHRFGDCAHEMGNDSVATCDVGFSGLGLHYNWRVGVKDFRLEADQQRQNPLSFIEAGKMEATVAGGTTRLYLEKDREDSYFRAKMAEVGLIEIRDVVFSNSTIGWHNKVVDTNADEFQRRLQEMLAFWVEYYIQYMTFLDGFNKAFMKAQN